MTVTTASAVASSASITGGERLRWRLSLEYWLAVYRRTWRGSVTSSILEPILFLLAMGIGLGSYVRGGSGHVDGVRYVVFLAPGLLASSAMQTAIGESTWPVMDAIKWRKSYHAMLASPLGVRDVMIGHLVYIVLRVFSSAIVFAVVIVVFGAAHHPLGLVLAVVAATLTGTAFAAAVIAFAATVERDTGFSLLFRFIVIPLFLFSGTFFPISQLPAGLRPVAWVTPLWHGVALCRDLMLAQGSVAGDFGHAVYLIAMAIVGVAVASVTYQRRLNW